MPIHNGSDSKGKFYQFGSSGKKYHYNTPIGKKRAYNKCLKQTKAIKGKGKSIFETFPIRIKPNISCIQDPCNKRKDVDK